MVGMHGNYGPNVLTNECDLLIAIGMRFDDRVTGNLETYAKQAKIIHFEIDPAEINKNIITNVPVIGDCKESLKLITKKIEKKSHSKWISKFDDLMKIGIVFRGHPKYHFLAFTFSLGAIYIDRVRQTNLKSFVLDVLLCLPCCALYCTPTPPRHP